MGYARRPWPRDTPNPDQGVKGPSRGPGGSKSGERGRGGCAGSSGAKAGRGAGHGAASGTSSRAERRAEPNAGGQPASFWMRRPREPPKGLKQGGALVTAMLRATGDEACHCQGWWAVGTTISPEKGWRGAWMRAQRRSNPWLRGSLPGECWDIPLSVDGCGRLRETEGPAVKLRTTENSSGGVRWVPTCHREGRQGRGWGELAENADGLRRCRP